MSSWDWSPEEQHRLAVFLEDRGLTAGPVTTRTIGDGHSNLTFLVTDRDDRRVVVRRPPPPPTPPGAHDMLREARLVGALKSSPVPVAELLATAEAHEVIDVHFYVMGFADGPVVTTCTPSPLDTPDVRRRIGESLIDTLAELHRVDWRSAGLESMGTPKGFNARHLRRMARLVADADGSLPPHFAEVGSWLAARVPMESAAAIVHNDYRVGNVVLSVQHPGEIAAVLDWELATIGDPLFDLGYFLVSIPEHGPVNPVQAMGAALLEPGYPTSEELADRYAQRTGADLGDLRWYTTFALWKLAVLYEYGRRRARRGVGDPYYLDQRRVQSFLEDAHRAAGIAPPLAAEPEETA
jgi:aminoglycoside phosphotransferase (APT) family kinase protein